MTRIMTWNIRTGLGNEPGAPGVRAPRNLERIAEVIQSENPDIVTLQELDRRRARSDYEDQPGILAGILSMEVVYGPNLVDSAGEYGVAILSKYAFLDARHERFFVADGWEPRGMLVTRVCLPDVGEAVITTTHLQVAFGEGEEDACHQRREAAETIGRALENVRMPVVLTGDFNTAPDAPELESLSFLQMYGRCRMALKREQRFPRHSTRSQLFGSTGFSPVRGSESVR